MTNIIGILNQLRDIVVKELLDHDVTILAIRIEENEGSRAARYVVHCKMDKWFMTWAEEYYHHREEFTENFDKVYVPFLDGMVFALIDLEDQ